MELLVFGQIIDFAWNYWFSMELLVFSGIIGFTLLPVSKRFILGRRSPTENMRPAIGDGRSATGIRESEVAGDGWRIVDGR